VLRNFLYVEDAARAFETVLHQGEVGHVYNLGGTNEKTVMQVTHDLIRAMGLADHKDELITYVEDRVFNDFRPDYACNFFFSLIFETGMLLIAGN
jgi:UDP-glucose 4,6-dehydratase